MQNKTFDEAYFHGKGSGYVEGYRLDSGLDQFFKRQITKIKKYEQEGIKICDIGCAYGFFLRMCDDCSWTTFGIDVSDYAIAEAQTRTKAELKVHDVECGVPYPAKLFDVITCFDVVEHLKNPSLAISYMCKNLTGGHLVDLNT